MRLDVTPILKENGGQLKFSYSEPLEMLTEGIGAIVFAGPVKFDGFVKNNNGMLTLEGNALVSYMTVCDRCAESLERTLEVPIMEDIIEIKMNDRVKEDSDVQEEEERFTFSGHILDIGVIAGELILLNAPFYCLCKDDCEGLCPECGTNLNLETCACASKRPLDSRLEALKSFFDKKQR